MKNVVNGIVKYGNRILVIKRTSHDKIHPDKWAFPGGLIEPNEDIISALKRELYEETGLEIKKIIKPINEYNYPDFNGSLIIGKSYLVETINNNVKISNEIADFKWVTLEEFFDLDTISDLSFEAMKSFE